MNGKESAVVGIDPGKTGAMALIAYSGEILIHDYQEIVYADDAIQRWKIDFYIIGACVEHVRPFKMNGSISNFSLGYSLGLWEAVLQNNDVPYSLIAPRTMQSEHAEYEKDSGLGGKKRSIQASHRLYPHSRDYVYRAKDHNRADAILLAHYAKKEFGLKS